MLVSPESNLMFNQDAGFKAATEYPPFSDEHYMAAALREAEKGLYTAHPNPRVGCVLVKDEVLIGTGFHLQTGSGHAEANAIAAASEAGIETQGSTAYCTLEPCSFKGRTPSCADGLIKAGIRRLVCAMSDPHPKNCGVGFDKLRAAGVEVTENVLKSSAHKLNPGHIKKYTLGLPYVRLKLAMSLDGKTALANGASQWITGVDARRDVQRLRARSSAIVTGVQTVLDDDPQLNVRPAELDVDWAQLAAEVSRKIIVLDPEKRIQATAQLLRNPDMVLATLAEPANDQHLDVRQIKLPNDGKGRIDLRALLQTLAQMDCNEVLFECGATLAGSLLMTGLVDELVIYLAPKLMGSDARSLMNFHQLSLMSEVPELEFTSIRRLGDDLRIIAKLKDK